MVVRAGQRRPLLLPLHPRFSFPLRSPSSLFLFPPFLLSSPSPFFSLSPFLFFCFC
ncbi:uncharacterized protein DS421_14g472620 [Arachis hypogaea]|nr:uncharacterized protein DS421_14g472620 [Arachis hypogaea]